VAEGARLESVYMATYRGFESLSLYCIFKTPILKCLGFYIFKNSLMALIYLDVFCLISDRRSSKHYICVGQYKKWIQN
jgi:hypothetical protein